MKGLNFIKGRPKSSQTQLVHGPVELLASPILQQRLAIFFGVGCLIFTIVMQFLYLKEMKTSERVLALDGAQTLHMGPLEKLQTRSVFFENLCLLAAQGIFQRSPVGLDLGEFNDVIFSQSAKEKIREDLERELEDIKERHLHQKPEIETIKIFQEKNDIRQFFVTGNIISAGHMGEIPISESHPFKLILVVTRNPKINERKTYPFIIQDLHIERSS